MNAPIFRATAGKKTDQKWDADSTRYADNLKRKSQAALPEPVQAWRLFLFAVGAVCDVDSALVTPILSAPAGVAAAQTEAEVLQS